MKLPRLKHLLLLVFAVAAVALAWLLWPRPALVSVELELNRLYGSCRPFAYRWTGAPYRPLGNGPCQVPLHTLQMLAGKLDKAERTAGRSARSLQLRGRINLLYGSYDDAVSKYRLALLLDPASSSLQLELGVSFALRAKAEDRALDYEPALEQMLESLQHSRTPETLFDTALLFEEVPLPLQAMDRWQDVIKNEPVPPWRDEAQSRRSKLERKLQAREQRMHDLTDSPASYLAHAEEAQDSIEIVMSEALEKWLPLFHTSPVHRRALERLADELKDKHHDPWLADLLQVPASPAENRALRALSDAWTANLRGEHFRAQVAAAAAEKMFRQLASPAGELRARVERAYALDRGWQQESCLKINSRIRSSASKHKYVWIEQQSWLQKISCLTATQKADVIHAGQQAYDAIAKGHYESLHLRALSFLTAKYGGVDSRLHTWNSGHKGLESFWGQPIASNRGYTFCYTMAASARSASDMQATGILLQEGLRLMERSPYRQLYALALSDLGTWQAEQGLRKDAEQTFGTMEALFDQLEKDEVLKFWRQAEISRVEADLAASDTLSAISRLQSLTKGMALPYPSFGPTERRHLLPALGDAFMAAGDLNSAQKDYQLIVSECTRDLKSIHSHAQRESALHEIESAWRGLANIRLRRGNLSEALNTWEAFRSGRLQNPSSVAVYAPPGVTLLVYAYLPDGLSAWLVTHVGIRQQWLEGERARRAAEQFATLVADPESPLELIQTSARQLYAALIGPFSASLPTEGLLIVDADRQLAGIPWSVLEDFGGHALVERFAISQALGWAEVSSQIQKNRINFSNALIMSDPTLSADLARQYPPLLEARDEAERLRRRLSSAKYFDAEKATSQALLDHLPNTSFFYFAGHGISYGGFGALLLAPTPGGTASAGIITAEQIARMRLSQLGLVVLASCSSGVGERSGVVNLDSLVRAFLEAGASRVVATRWNVSSPATSALMIRFYEVLVQQQGKRPAEALRTAALEVRRQPQFAHPYYWAGFQVFGTP